MAVFKPGLCSVSFRGNSPEEILRAMTDAGLRCIEWGSDVHAPYTDTDKLTHIASLQSEYGIVCSSYGTYFRIGETDTEELYGYIRAAEILGTKLLWCGAKGSAAFDEAEKKQFFDTCRRVAQIAEECGVTVAMECHQWTYTDTAESIIELMSEVDSPNFRMYWQPNQYRTVEENIHHIEMTKKHVTTVHAFNWDGSEKFTLSESAEVWREYLSRLDGEHHVLLEFMPDDRLESLGAEADALRGIIESVEK